MASVGSTSAPSPKNLEQRVTEALEREVKRVDHLGCILRIPAKLRTMNPNAYTPSRVAIGPYHCVKDSSLESSLELSEPYKIAYLASLIRRSDSKDTKLQDYMDAIENRVSEAWEYYAGTPKKLTQEEFKTMLLLDGAFIVEFFCRCMDLAYLENPDDEMLRQVRVFISSSRGPVHGDNLSDHAIKYEILRDLILLENQLPYFILQSLFKLTFQGRDRPNKLSFSWIAYFCLDYLIPVHHKSMSMIMTFQQFHDMENTSQAAPLHLVHLIRTCCLFPVPPTEARVPIAADSVKCPNKGPDYEFRCVSVTELNHVGVRFKMGKSNNLFKIHFDEGQGVITLPSVIFNDTTEMFFRNVMAFEQYYLNEYQISGYMCFMDRIVDTHRDVKILERNNIICNWLDSKKSVSKILNGMNAHTGINYHEYRDTSKNITAYANKPWNKYKSMLRRDYFGSPWAIISIIAALLLLVLTALQTIATIRSTKW